MDAEPVTLVTQDARELSGLLVPTAQARGALLINSATGFPREFYLKFADYAASRGYATLVYDYRGMGASRHGPVKDERVLMSDWGVYDIPAAFLWLTKRFPTLPLFTLGHSVGGQFIGLLPDPQQARAHVFIAVSTGYWRFQRNPFRYQALMFWKVYGPAVIRLIGYVPQGVLWTGLPLPRGVFEEWRDWCLRPSHFGSTLPLKDVKGPLLVCGFTDDAIATPPAVKTLLGFYPNAKVEQRWISPAQIGAKHIGHHGFFSQRHRESLWKGVIDWLDAQVAEAAGSAT